MTTYTAVTDDRTSVPTDGGIDAGLLLLMSTPAPGDGVWSHREIAYVCGCSRSYIWLLEQQALENLREALIRRGFRKEQLNVA